MPAFLERFKMAIPVYMFTGFLESGKTQFIKDTLLDPGFTEDEKTLIIACEEGEVEYDQEFLKETNSYVFYIESEEDFKKSILQKAVKDAKADRIILEYNGMWDIHLVEQRAPFGWDIYQTVTTINAETYELYLKNMGPKIIEHVGISEMVIFNRCTPELKEYIRTTNVLAMNPRAMIFLEDEYGDAEDYKKGMPLPYDITSDIIELKDHQFGDFYVDLMNDPGKYHGKSVKTKVLVHRQSDYSPERFAAGRFAMVCCADDISYIAVFCDMPDAASIVEKESWANITAQIEMEYLPELGEDCAVLKVASYEKADKPDEELIYFR